MNNHRTIYTYLRNSKYYEHYDYPTFSEKTTELALKKLALICQNEILYADFYNSENTFKNKRLHLSAGSDIPYTLEEAEAIIKQAEDMLENRRYLIDTIVKGHNDRYEKHNHNDRYAKWRDTAAFIFLPFDYCFCCGKQAITYQIDHIFPHNNFKDEQKAYSLCNSQKLCKACNQTKQLSDSTDYRTKEHKKALLAFIDETGKHFIK